MNTPPVTCFVQNATLHGWLSVLGAVEVGGCSEVVTQANFFQAQLGRSPWETRAL